MNLLRELWVDEYGFILSAELVFKTSVCCICLVVGTQTIRDAVLQELGDVAAAIGAVSQDYSYGGATGHCSAIAGSVYVDAIDFCETSAANSLNCVTVCVPAANEE